MPFLVAFNGKTPSLHPLGDAPMVLGREKKVDLPLSDFQISRRHAELRLQKKQYFVRDLGSRNGFFVNRRHIKPGAESVLKDGDEIILGRTGLRFYENEPAELDSLSPVVIPEALKTPGERGLEDSASKAIEDPPSNSDSGKAAAEKGQEAEAAAAPDKDLNKDLNKDLIDEDLLRYAAKPAAAKRFNELSEQPDADSEPPPARKDSARAGKAESNEKADSARRKAKKGASKAELDTVGKADKDEKTEKSEKNERDKDASARRRAKGSARKPVNSELDRIEDGRVAVAAEVHTLRAMLDRSDREREFYRMVVLGLVLFLIMLVALLLAKVLGSSKPPTPPPVTVSSNGGSGKSGGKPPKPVTMNQNPPSDMSLLDAEVFKSQIHPWLKQACGQCHSASSRTPMKLRLDDVEASLRGIAVYVTPDFPDTSPLLLKPLAVGQGGQVHGGGELLTIDMPMFATLRDWISNTRRPDEAPRTAKPDPQGDDAAKMDLEPKAVISLAASEVSTGSLVTLDGSASISKTNSSLLATWTMVSRPPDSSARIDDDGALVTQFRPDLPGEYKIQLYVQDGAYGDRTFVTVIATGEAMGGAVTPTEPKPAMPDKPKEPEGPPMADLAPLYKLVTGKDIDADSYKKVLAKDLKRSLRKMLATSEARVHLLTNELQPFGLNGPSAPPSYYLKTIAQQFDKVDNFTILSAIVELAISPFFNAKYPDAKTYSDALVQACLGRKPKGGEKPAITKMYEGKEAKLFNETGRGVADAAAILLRQPEFSEAFIKRCYQLYKSAEPSAEEISAGQATLKDEPDKFFRLVEKWILP